MTGAQDERPIDPMDSTAVLVGQARAGDARAREKLAGRYRTALRLWAHGRLPDRARDLVDTDDLVQSAIFRAMNHLDRFEPRGEGSFLAYVRQILLNQIRDEVRRAHRRPDHAELSEMVADKELSPLERVIQQDRLESYERALEALLPNQREAVIMRLELGFRYREIAEALGLPSGNAARTTIARALVRMARAVRR